MSNALVLKVTGEDIGKQEVLLVNEFGTSMVCLSKAGFEGLIKQYYEQVPTMVAPEVVEDPPKRRATDVSVPALLEGAAATFRERNAVYKDNKDNVGQVLKALFPNGIHLATVEDFTKWHLFELAIVKMTRFANSGLTHVDSIHDQGIYTFMVESEVIKNG
jgi:hypothetical protein